MNKKLDILLLVLVFSGVLVCQTKNNRVKWINKAFEDKVFIGNKGQFNDRKGIETENILYGIEGGNLDIYFTPSGILYYYSSFEEVGEDYDDYESELEKKKLSVEVIKMDWVNSNKHAEVIVEDLQEAYYNYETEELTKAINHVKAYKKLIYKNLYPGIDAEFFFVENVSGIKYNLIVQPIANIDYAKMKYTGGILSKDGEGNIFIKSGKNEIKDMAPKTFYKNGGLVIESFFEVEGDTVLLRVKPYDRDQSIIFDPLITSPNFGVLKGGYDIDVDKDGNIFVMGGGTGTGGTGGYSLKKFTSGGSLLWTFAISNSGLGTFYGDFEIDTLGNAFIVKGGFQNSCIKISPLGTQIANSIILMQGLNESWRLKLNNVNNRLYAGGGFSASNNTFYSLAEININGSGALTSTPQQTSFPGSINDREIRAMDIDITTGDIYGLMVSPASLTDESSNRLIKYNNNMEIIYELPSRYLEDEKGMAYTNISGDNVGFNGFNGVAVDVKSRNLYTYDGLKLIKRDKYTGVFIDSTNIPYTLFDRNSGICIDSCGSVFVGTQQYILKYDSSLVKIDSVATPGAVYDLTKPKGGQLFAVGNDFLGAFVFEEYCPSEGLNVKSQIIIPNVFSPNGDGINDFFVVKSKNIDLFKCTLYNRWGQMVNELSSKDENWNGNDYNGKMLPGGVYFYSLNAMGMDKINHLQYGTIQLVR